MDQVLRELDYADVAFSDASLYVCVRYLTAAMVINSRTANWERFVLSLSSEVYHLLAILKHHAFIAKLVMTRLPTSQPIAVAKCK